MCAWSSSTHASERAKYLLRVIVADFRFICLRSQVTVLLQSYSVQLYRRPNVPYTNLVHIYLYIHMNIYIYIYIFFILGPVYAGLTVLNLQGSTCEAQFLNATLQT